MNNIHAMLDCTLLTVCAIIINPTPCLTIININESISITIVRIPVLSIKR